MADHSHTWTITAPDWDDLPEEVTGCATCQECGKQEFVYRCPDCLADTIGAEPCDCEVGNEDPDHRYQR